MTLKGRFQNLPIRYKFLTLFAAVFLLAAAGGGLGIDILIRKNMEHNIESELTNTTETLRDMIETAASSSAKNRLRAIAEKNNEIVGHFYNLQVKGLISEKDARMQAAGVLLSQKIGATGYIYCVNSHGIIQVHPKAALQDKDISSYENIRKQMQIRKGYMEYDWKNPQDKQPRAKALYMIHFKPWDWIISVSCYRDELGQLVNVNDFRDSVLNRKFGTTGYSFVMDNDGTLVIHPKQEGKNILKSRDADGRYYIKEMRDMGQGKIIYPWKNPGEVTPREKLVIFNRIPEFNWIVASSSYLSEFYSPLRAVHMIIIITITAALLVTLPFVLYISNMITKPLRDLVQRMNMTGDGRYHQRMDISTTEEIGALSRCFNRFMEQLESNHRELENRVKKRTRDLEEEVRVRTHAEKKLQDQALFLNTFINTIPSPVFYKDRAGAYQGCNRAFSKFIMGIPENVIKGKTLFDLPDLIPAHLAEAYHKKDQDLMESGGTQVYEHQVKCADGITRDYQFSKATYSDGEGCVAGLAGVMLDITDINRARMEIERQSEKISATNMELEKLASRDSLTGLYNRRIFQEQLNAQAHLSRRNKTDLSIILIDIDHFKKYNDTFGHPAGDEVLAQVGELMKACARKSDITARYGGEEFAVILPNTGKKGALIMARRFHISFLEHQWPGREITISCGVATTRFDSGETPIPQSETKDLVSRADRALYYSKGHGRNQSNHIDDI